MRRQGEDSCVSGLAPVMKLRTFRLSLPKWPDSVIALCYPISTKDTLSKVWMSISSAAAAAVSVLKLNQWEVKRDICKKSGVTCTLGA